METSIKLSENKIFWKDFCWGEIIPKKSVFQLTPRTKRNIFHLFGGGLGLNTQALELLNQLNVKFIDGKLSGKPFRVPVNKWIEKGKKSPFKSETVDPQTILDLKEIFSEENSNQTSLFGRA